MGHILSISTLPLIFYHARAAMASAAQRAVILHTNTSNMNADARANCIFARFAQFLCKKRIFIRSACNLM
jgi:hypothetical protein